MRITLVSPYDPAPTSCQDDRLHVGGVERVLHHLSQGLARRGHDVTLLCSTQGASSERQEGGIHVIREHRSGTLLGTPLVQLAKRIPKDTELVHVPATYPFTTPPVLRRAKKLGIPSVLDFHFEPHPASRLGRLAATVYGGIGPPHYALAEAALVRSFSYGRSARALASVPEARWRVVPNGIDPSTFHPGNGARKGDYVLFVGRLVPYKGVDVLVRALAAHPERPKLVVAGEGPSEASLKALSHKLGVDATFLGRVPDQSLADLYRGANVTVLPSIAHQEAFGITLLESMACGTPVVASDLPGVDEVALLGGLLAPPGDATSLGNQIQRATEPALLARGTELATKIHRGYSWDAITTRVLDVYNEIVHRRHDGTPGVTRIAHPRSNPVL